MRHHCIIVLCFWRINWWWWWWWWCIGSSNRCIDFLNCSFCDAYCLLAGCHCVRLIYWVKTKMMSTEGEGHRVFRLFMVALCNIFILFLSSFFFFFFFFFLALSQRSEIGCLPYFGSWCGLSANLECRPEMRCTRLAANTGRKKSPSRHHRTTLLGHIFATKACIDNRKKNCKAAISPLHVPTIWWTSAY